MKPKKEKKFFVKFQQANFKINHNFLGCRARSIDHFNYANTGGNQNRALGAAQCITTMKTNRLLMPNQNIGGIF